MTNKEMTELFAVMMLAWPGAEMFKGGIRKLGPTIELWTLRTRDIDFWMGQQAVGRLIDTCKFPPTIAEFREQAAHVASDIKNEIDYVFNQIKFADYSKGGLDGWYRRLPPDSAHKATIDAMGGLSRLTTADGKMLNYALYEETYNRLLRTRNVKSLPGRECLTLSEAEGGNHHGR